MEAHVGKIRAFDPRFTLPIVYFRIAARGAPRALRAPALERLLARADGRSSVASWRAAAFRVIALDRADPPPIAVAQLRAAGGTACDGWAALASPVHLVAGMSSVQLPADGLLQIDSSEAEALAEDFNRAFAGGGSRLVRGSGSGLICVFDAPLTPDTTPPDTTPPDEALGSDVWAHQPRGRSSAELRRLGTEIEMWLFDHELNAARRARGLPLISALWLWGAGALDAPLPRVAGWAAGDDVLFSAFDRRSQYPGAAGAGAGGSEASKSGVVVMAAWPGTAAWQESEHRWLRPALDDLKAGYLSGIEISAGDCSFSLSARGLRRFWRRSQPWWRSFGLTPEEDSRIGR
jgi:hypothetical protein